MCALSLFLMIPSSESILMSFNSMSLTFSFRSYSSWINLLWVCFLSLSISSKSRNYFSSLSLSCLACSLLSYSSLPDYSA